MTLKQTLSQYWEKIQGTLFPQLEEDLPTLTKKQQQLVSILEIIRVEKFVFPTCPGFRGRLEKSRRAILRAFAAKAVYNMPTTRMLIERLHIEKVVQKKAKRDQRKCRVLKNRQPV